MNNYKMIISYDGTNYYGFQRQNNFITIQEEVERALKIIFNDKGLSIISSIRTDKGVHANNHVINFFHEKEIELNRLKKSFNSLVNRDIYCKQVTLENSDFHARYHADKKEYIYIINNGEYNTLMHNYEMYVEKKLDIEKMISASKKIIGTHDFKAFTITECKKESVKTIYDIKITLDKEKIIISILGNGFLRYMVRTIVGLLIDIGLNKKNETIIDIAFEKKDRKVLGKMADSQGLYLNEVFYKIYTNNL